MERWNGRVAVVTGASGGIGAAVAVALADAGLTVVGLARRPHLIQELSTQVSGAGSLIARECDVSLQDRVEETFAWIRESLGGADLLVNNAALIYHGSICSYGPNPVTAEALSATVDVNIKSILFCSRPFIDSIKERNVDGHIININSIGGHYVPSSPVFNVYSATKHAVTALTRTMHNEFSHFGVPIKITSLSPGLVATEMAQAHNMPELRDMMQSAPVLSPKDIADAVLYVVGTPRHVNITELTVTPFGEKKF